MTAKGYKGIMVKEAVAEKLRAEAKESGKTITVFLDEILETYDKGTSRVSDISNKSLRELEGDMRDIMREVLEELRR